MVFGMSGGGVHETTDGGGSWRVIIDGMEVVQGFNLDPTIPTCHDPHCLRMCSSFQLDWTPHLECATG